MSALAPRSPRLREPRHDDERSASDSPNVATRGGDCAVTGMSRCSRRRAPLNGSATSFMRTRSHGSSTDRLGRIEVRVHVIVDRLHDVPRIASSQLIEQVLMLVSDGIG